MKQHMIYGGVLVIITVYLEILLHIHIMGASLNADFIRVIVFSAGYATLAFSVVRLFKRKWALTVLGFFIFGVSFTVFALDVYYQIMGDFFSLFMGGDVMLGITFIGRFFKNLEAFHGLYFLPLIGYISVSKRLFIKRYVNVIEPLIMASVGFSFIYLALLMISPTPLLATESPFNYSDLDIYEKQPSAYQVINQFGALTYLRLDLQSLSTSPEESTFDPDEFFALRPEMEDNDYTGMFADMNVIYILAESFDTLAIDPDITPVLYQLFERGWSFENFYAPHYYRNTADTEFMVHTGFYPSRQVALSMDHFKDNTFRQTLPRLLQDTHRTYAYHNYTDYFYPRSVFLEETIGFDVYKDALDLALLDEEVGVGGPHEWPSDVDLFQSSVDDYIEDDRFYTYYLTVSGHMNYNENHPMVAKNLATVQNVLESRGRTIENEELRAYYAAQLELEYMVSEVLNTLNETGRIQDTVLVLASDHYPYGLDEASFEAASRPLDEAGLDIHNVPFVMYHPSLKAHTFDDVFSSVDVLPTLANLLGLKVDSTQMFGTDVFADASNTVRFQNSSLLTRDYTYDITALNPAVSLNSRVTEEMIMIAFNEMIYLQDLNHLLLESDYQKGE